MEIEKVLRILAIFITVAAFAIFVASQLMFETSLGLNIPIIVLLVLAISSIWRDTRRTKEQNPQ
ncbi:hypothetical protein [uncultured Alistipes sp.]|uniref:hypothetical protein n=1 Tax=uncultured Alistipes sp. TaxID=538949 RepID=UPI0025F8D120|nr:hypothetical protein [uncultured Alistipes sp.]